VLSSCGIKEVNRYQKFTRRRCMAGVNTITISSSGDVRPCGHFETNYGNLLQEDLSDVWQRMTEWRDGSMIPASVSLVMFYHDVVVVVGWRQK